MTAERVALVDMLVKRHSHDGLTDAGLRYVLEHAYEALRAAPQRPVVEIGSYKGATALALLELVAHMGQEPLICTVDPYGGKPYKGAGVVWDYPGGLYRDPVYLAQKANLVAWANHAHFLMTGVHFLRRVVGMPYWRNGVEQPLERFSFVFLDGDHDKGTVLTELSLVIQYLAPGGRCVIDNVDSAELLQALTGENNGWGIELGPVTEPGARQAVYVRPT